MITSLVSVPILLALLGSDGYGTFVTITAVAAWTQLGTLGIGKGLLNALVECHARDDRDLARKYVASLWVGLGGVVVFAAILVFAAFPWIPWPRVFAVTDVGFARDVTFATGVTLALTLMLLVLSPTMVIYSAYQEESRSSLWSAIRNLATFAAVVIAARSGMRIIGVAVLTSGAAVLIDTFSTVYLFRRAKPFLRPRRSDPSLALIRQVLPGSISFFLIEIAALLVFQVDKLILIQFVGGGEVSKFELTSRVFLLAYSGLVLVLGPLWPAIGEAIHRGDMEWSRRALRRVSAGAAGTILVLTVVMVFAGGDLVRAWARNGDVIADAPLFAIIGAYFVVRAWTDTHTTVLYSVGAQREILWTALAHGGLSVGLGLLLGRAYGTIGVATANLAAFVVTASWFVTWRAHRRLRETLVPTP